MVLCSPPGSCSPAAVLLVCPHTRSMALQVGFYEEQESQHQGLWHSWRYAAQLGMGQEGFDLMERPSSPSCEPSTQSTASPHSHPSPWALQ